MWSIIAEILRRRDGQSGEDWQTFNNCLLDTCFNLRGVSGDRTQHQSLIGFFVFSPVRHNGGRWHHYLSTHNRLSLKYTSWRKKSIWKFPLNRVQWILNSNWVFPWENYVILFQERIISIYLTKLHRQFNSVSPASVTSVMFKFWKMTGRETILYLLVLKVTSQYCVIIRSHTYSNENWGTPAWLS